MWKVIGLVELIECTWNLILIKTYQGNVNLDILDLTIVNCIV